jgi:hypothetical protein
MIPETFKLLQNEGALMQGCFKSSLSGLRTANSAERGLFYAAFFNYAIGLERLLKVLLLLDSWHRERRFPDNEALKQQGGRSGHDVEKLYESARKLISRYGVEWKAAYDPDEINRDLLNFLADFANGSRYFNLDNLAGPSKSADPVQRWETLLYRVHAKDIAKEQPTDTAGAVRVPDPDSLSLGKLAGHHAKIAAASRHICWRLVQLLVPLQALLIAVCEQVHADDLKIGGESAAPSVPYMEEFLEFVCDDNSIILKSEDWP